MSRYIGPPASCASCRQTRPRFARRLCEACYYRHRDAGTLDEYPRVNRRSVDVAEDYAFLAADGYSREQAAARLGISRNTLDQALSRARRAAAVAA